MAKIYAEMEHNRGARQNEIDQRQRAEKETEKLQQQLQHAQKKNGQQPLPNGSQPCNSRHESGVGDLLERTIPKMIGVRLHLKTPANFVNADTAQLEQVLKKLAVNAGDVMLKGGILTIETTDILLDYAVSG